VENPVGEGVATPTNVTPGILQKLIDNKAVPRCFTECWHKGNAQIVDELGADDLVFSFRLHGELRGREPKLNFRSFEVVQKQASQEWPLVTPLRTWTCS
jgi:hypothetical protein